MPSNAEILAERTDGKSESIVAFNPLTGLQLEDLLEVLEKLASKSARRPTLTLRHACRFLKAMMAVSRSRSSYAPDPSDRRFADPAWAASAFSRKLLQSYIALTESLSEWLSDIELSGVDKKRAEFLIRLLGDSISPNNFLISNPVALQKARETRGSSLVSGAGNLIWDLKHNHGIPSQVKADAFEVGEDLANSKGQVVFRNEILELIQYQPTTDKVHRRPLLIATAMINKYYAADLRPGRSFIEYATGCGLQVFAVSWANPTRHQANWGVTAYAMAIAEAIEAIQSITKCQQVNVFGMCSGGVVTSALAAYLTSNDSSAIHSLMLAVCVLDWHPDDTEMGAFANEKLYEKIKKRSRKAGVLKGHELALSTLLLRPRDLIWDNVVNNYLMGNDPPEFDLLHWNNDRTNLSAQLHSDLIDIARDNSLMTPGAWELNKVPLDLGKVKKDMFFVAGASDHMTPWPACYRSMRAFGGDKTFVLSNSGHIQTLLNSPDKKNASFFTNSTVEEDSNKWLESAELREGSWWAYWRDWLIPRSLGQKSAPKKLGNSQFPPLANAPGTYIFQKAI